MSITIEELLNSMQNKYKSDGVSSIKKLENTKENWKRIRNKDNFEDLGFSSDSEKEEFLKQWISENPYSNTL